MESCSPPQGMSWLVRRMHRPRRPPAPILGARQRISRRRKAPGSLSSAYQEVAPCGYYRQTVEPARRRWARQGRRSIAGAGDPVGSANGCGPSRLQLVGVGSEGNAGVTTPPAPPARLIVEVSSQTSMRPAIGSCPTVRHSAAATPLGSVGPGESDLP